LYKRHLKREKNLQLPKLQPAAAAAAAAKAYLEAARKASAASCWPAASSNHLCYSLDCSICTEFERRQIIYLAGASSSYQVTRPHWHRNCILVGWPQQHRWLVLV
jgi:hypothetical protein